MNIKYLESEQDFQSWDMFLQSSPRGHYAALSTWLKSFNAYGATFKIVVLEKEQNIIAGLGMVVFGKGAFKLVTVMVGPVLNFGAEQYDNILINESISYSKKIGAFLFQIRIPYNQSIHSDFLLHSVDLPESVHFQKGYPFKVASAPNLLFLVDLGKEKYSKQWEEEILMGFKSETRRNIRKALNNNLELRVAENEEMLRRAYAIIEENGSNQGYAVRTWDSFRDTLILQVEKKQAIVLMAFIKDELLGAHYGVISGGRYSYIMGGTKRTKKDYKVGHYLHWNAIVNAKKMNLKAYDLLATGSSGVKRFKEGFRPLELEFDTPYFTVLSSWKYYLFVGIFPYMKKYKKYLAKIANTLLKK